MTKLARLGDVTESMKNGLYKHASQYGEDGLPCLRMYNIEAGGIVWRDIKRMRVSSAEREDYGLREGDLLVNRVNSRELVGKTAVILADMEPSVFESKNIRLRLKADQVRPKFINYQLLVGGRRYFSDNAQQVVGMASVSQTQLADFPIVLTDLATQDKIVAEIEKQFSRLDGAVANLKRVKANLKRYKAAVLKAAVEGRLVPTEAELARQEGRSYETGAQLLQRILETRRSQWQGKGKREESVEADARDLSGLPEGWCWATIAQLAVVVRGGSPRPAGDPRYFGGTVPWITVGTLTADSAEYFRHTRDTLTVEGKERSRFIEPHTLLLTNSGATLGVPKISLIGGCINDGVAAFLNVRYPLKLYLLHFLSTLTDSMRRINQGAAQPNLNTSIIKSTRVPLPPSAEQERVVAEVDRRLSLVRTVEGEVDANLKRAERLRQSVLARAFTGPAVNDRPASNEYGHLRV